MEEISKTVDGSEIRRSPVEVGSFNAVRTGFSTIPGGCLAFLNHQQYGSENQWKILNSCLRDNLHGGYPEVPSAEQQEQQEWRTTSCFVSVRYPYGPRPTRMSQEVCKWLVNGL